MALNLRSIALNHKEKLSKITVFLSDVDGVLTNGLLYYSGEEVGYNRFFHACDGYGLKVLKRAGLKVGVVTGGDSVGVKKRFTDLGLDYLYFGNEDKREAFNDILSKGHSPEEILYIGDEFFDLPILKKVGFAATVPHASEEIKEAVDYVTGRPGGMGAVREVVDLVRHVQGIIPHVEY